MKTGGLTLEPGLLVGLRTLHGRAERVESPPPSPGLVQRVMQQRCRMSSRRNISSYTNSEISKPKHTMRSSPYCDT
jgi:hypothetical protein